MSDAKRNRVENRRRSEESEIIEGLVTLGERQHKREGKDMKMIGEERRKKVIR